MADYACIFTPMPPTTNNLFVNNPRTGGRFPSRPYKAWQEEAQRAAEKQAPLPQIEGKVNLTISLGRPDQRRRDLSNYVKAIEDFAVRNAVIQDDSLVEKLTVQWDRDVIGCRLEVEGI